MPAPPWTPEEEESLAAITAHFPRGHPRWAEEKWVDCFFMGRFRQTGRTVQDLVEWGTTTEEWDDSWASASQAGESLHPLNIPTHTSIAHPRPLSTCSSSRLLELALADSQRSRRGRTLTPFPEEDELFSPPSPPPPAAPVRSNSREGIPSGRYCAPPSSVASTATHVSATPTPSRQGNNSPPPITESSIDVRRSIAGDIVTNFGSSNGYSTDAILFELDQVAQLSPADRDRIFTAIAMINDVGLTGRRGAAANTRPGEHSRWLFVEGGDEPRPSRDTRRSGQQETRPAGAAGEGSREAVAHVVAEDKASTVASSPRSGPRRREASEEPSEGEPNARRVRTKPPTPPSPTITLPGLQKAPSEVSRTRSGISKAPSEASIHPIPSTSATRPLRPTLTTPIEPPRTTQHASPPSPVASLEPEAIEPNLTITSSPSIGSASLRPAPRNQVLPTAAQPSTSTPPVRPTSAPIPPPAASLRRSSSNANPSARRLDLARRARASASPAPQAERSINRATRATSAVPPTSTTEALPRPATSSPLPALGPAASFISLDPSARQPTRARPVSLFNPTIPASSDIFQRDLTHPPLALARPPPPSLPSSSATARTSALSFLNPPPLPSVMRQLPAISNPTRPTSSPFSLLPSRSRTTRNLSPTSTASSITDLPLDVAPPPRYRPLQPSAEAASSDQSSTFVTPEEVQAQAASMARRRSARISTARAALETGTATGTLGAVSNFGRTMAAAGVGARNAGGTRRTAASGRRY